MPNEDGTGPQGKGPLTGRRLGGCKGAKVCTQEFERGRGLGKGLGRRRARLNQA